MNNDGTILIYVNLRPSEIKTPLKDRKMRYADKKAIRESSHWANVTYTDVFRKLAK